MTLATLGLASLGPSGCSGCPPDVDVSGRDRNDPTWLGTQSEAVAASSRSRDQNLVVVAYNDDTEDGTIKYTTNDRIVFPGASLMGWSYSADQGKTWVYGGKVKPPAGIAALWGDPALVTSQSSYNRVYLSSLAIAASKIPASGHHGWMDDGAITGACIARSDDGGIHFAIQSCPSADADFYDGAALAAAGTGGDERIFAAYVDVPKDRIDVWASANGLSPFVRIADPFPGMRMRSHPRMAYDRATGALLVAAIEASSQLIWMNRLVGNAWQRPIIASKPVTRIDIPVGSQTIRMAYGFSFDVGAPSQTVFEDGSVKVHSDAIRLLYTTRDARTQRIYVRGSGCAANLSACFDVPQWGTTPGNLNTPRNQWNPTVTAWPGFIGLPPVWKATYQTTDDTPDGVSIKQGNLTRLPDSTAIFLPFDLVPARPVCPDFRYGAPGAAKSGYWGDYDEKTMVGFSDQVPEWLLPFSDSSKGCISQSEFTSNHLHVSSVVFQ
jgi:hypothetical protein